MTTNETIVKLTDRIAKLEGENRLHHNTAEKLVESDLMSTARIAAIERFVRELAMESLGDTPETANLCKNIDKYFHQKLKEIKNFKSISSANFPASN
jgi:hypothetical protein